jgi:hypothetical protein
MIKLIKNLFNKSQNKVSISKDLWVAYLNYLDYRVYRTSNPQIDLQSKLNEIGIKNVLEFEELVFTTEQRIFIKELNSQKIPVLFNRSWVSTLGVETIGEVIPFYYRDERMPVQTSTTNSKEINTMLGIAVYLDKN